MDRTAAKCEIGLGILLTCVAVAVGVETFKIPHLSFDPLGGRAVPFWVSVIVALFSMSMAARGYLTLRTDISSPDQGGQTPNGSIRKAICMALLMVAYGVAFHLEVNFELATIGFLGLSIAYLSGWQRHWVGYGIAIALVAAFGLHYLFTEVLVIDLP